MTNIDKPDTGKLDTGSSLDEKVGHAVKGARTQSGMTLMELSSKANVSAAMISKIERGQVSASLSTLNALSQAMGVPVINLFAETVERSDYSFVKAGDGVTVQRVGNAFGHTYRMIGRVNPALFDVEPYLITFEQPMGGQPIYQHSGIEFIHVLEGSIQYRCGTWGLFDLRNTVTAWPGSVENTKSCYFGRDC
ncbi:MAG: helix-turn-helix domain-containing protein [Alphaproteobacteria bacterium]|nr:helix-turn-helix domain-containing protein [Alphaproteobacteria bacterium]